MTSGNGQRSKLLRVGQVDPNGLISHLERGALPRPATSFRIVTAIHKANYWLSSDKSYPVD
jgi:hypothetical protein